MSQCQLPRSWHRGCPWGPREVAACVLATPRGRKRATPTTASPLPAHRDDVGSLLSGWSFLEDFGFSKMNLLRRSVSELAWAPAYSSPAYLEDSAMFWEPAMWCQYALRGSMVVGVQG